MDGDLMGNYSDSLIITFSWPPTQRANFVYFRPFAHALLGLQLLLVFLHQK